MIVTVSAILVCLGIGYCIFIVIKEFFQKHNPRGLFLPAVIKVVTPVYTTTKQLIKYTYSNGKSFITKLYTDKPAGQHVDYYVRRSNKELKKEQEIKEYKKAQFKSDMDKINKSEGFKPSSSFKCQKK